MDRKEMCEIMAAAIKDRLENPAFAYDKTYYSAADDALGKLEGKLHTPFETLFRVFRPMKFAERVKYEGENRRNINFNSANDEEMGR